MASPADVPRIAEPIAGNGGFVTRAWLDFFLKLASAQTEQNLAELYAQLAARVAELEDGQSLSFQLLGQGSIGVQGIPQPGGAVIITLQNDDDVPGNTMYYGTGPNGDKGWFSVSSAIAGTADQIVNTTGPDGVATLSLAPAVITSLSKADSALQSIVPGLGITVNNADPRNPIVSAPGSGFAPPPTDGSPYIGLNGAWEQANAASSRFFLIEYPLLTDQAGNQLTDQAGNPLIANSPLIPPGWPSMTTVVVAAAPQVMTLAQANALSGALDGQEVLITDLAGGREPCWYDGSISSGTRWRRYSDRSIAN